MNKKTDCWRCGLTFGKKIIIGKFLGHTFKGKIIYPYHEKGVEDAGHILCEDCMEIEEEEQMLKFQEVQK